MDDENLNIIQHPPLISTNDCHKSFTCPETSTQLDVDWNINHLSCDIDENSLSGSNNVYPTQPSQHMVQDTNTPHLNEVSQAELHSSLDDDNNQPQQLHSDITHLPTPGSSQSLPVSQPHQSSDHIVQSMDVDDQGQHHEDHSNMTPDHNIPTQSSHDVPPSDDTVLCEAILPEGMSHGISVNIITDQNEDQVEQEAGHDTRLSADDPNTPPVVEPSEVPEVSHTHNDTITTLPAVTSATDDQVTNEQATIHHHHIEHAHTNCAMNECGVDPQVGNHQIEHDTAVSSSITSFDTTNNHHDMQSIVEHSNGHDTPHNKDPNLASQPLTSSSPLPPPPSSSTKDIITPSSKRKASRPNLRFIAPSINHNLNNRRPPPIKKNDQRAHDGMKKCNGSKCDDKDVHSDSDRDGETSDHNNSGGDDNHPHVIKIRNVELDDTSIYDIDDDDELIQLQRKRSRQLNMHYGMHGNDKVTLSSSSSNRHKKEHDHQWGGDGNSSSSPSSSPSSSSSSWGYDPAALMSMLPKLLNRMEQLQDSIDELLLLNRRDRKH